MSRQNNLRQWLQDCYPNVSFTLKFAAADADYRRYFRAAFSDATTVICMDAPPAQIDMTLYLARQKLFAPHIRVPQIYHFDLQQGFMALEDFGDDTLIKVMEKNPDSERQRQLLLQAIPVLISLQRASHPKKLPAYSKTVLNHEMDLFPVWCAPFYFKKPFSPIQMQIWKQVKALLLKKISEQPRVYVHRDFIIRNLMLLTDGQLGVIDFQDALCGPVTYDIASLTRDAFMVWPETLTKEIVREYWQQALRANLPVAPDFGNFYRDYEYTGVQRHLKVAGIFTRLNYRDGKAKYLEQIPVFIRYLTQTCRRYPELTPLAELVREVAQSDKNQH